MMQPPTILLFLHEAFNVLSIIVIFSIVAFSVLNRIGVIQRVLQLLAENALSKEINGAKVTIANLELNLLNGRIMFIDVIIHTPGRNEWKWDSPLFLRVGKMQISLNILSFITPINAYLGYPCMEIYNIYAEDIQIFVEKRRNVFNFHLLDQSLEIPNSKVVMASLNLPKPVKSINNPEIPNSSKEDTEKINISERHGTLNTKSSFESEMSTDSTTSLKNSNIVSNKNKESEVKNVVDPSAKEKADKIVTSMLGAVSTLGRAVNEGGKEGFEKALGRQKNGFVKSLKQFKQRNESVGDILRSHFHVSSHQDSTSRTQNFIDRSSIDPKEGKNKRVSMQSIARESLRVMKQMGKAVEKNVSEIQQQIDSYKKPPPKKKGWVKKETKDVFRFGWIVLSDVRIFTKGLVLSNNSNNADDSTGEAESCCINANKKFHVYMEKENSISKPSNSTYPPNANGWSRPILIEVLNLTSADLCPPLSLRDADGLPVIGQKIDAILDVIAARFLAELAKGNPEKVLKIAVGNVFPWM